MSSVSLGALNRKARVEMFWQATFEPTLLVPRHETSIL